VRTVGVFLRGVTLLVDVADVEAFGGGAPLAVALVFLSFKELWLAGFFLVAFLLDFLAAAGAPFLPVLS